MEEKILKLTNSVYKLLEFFPESDPLKNRAKDKALAIMSAYGKSSLEEDIDALLGYLWIAKTQGWLNPMNCLIISNEYEKIRKEATPAMLELTQKLPGIEDLITVQKSKPKEPKAIPSSVLNNMGADSIEAPIYFISERQTKIIEFLKKNEKAQVMDLQTILPNVTKRTIRRDLDDLLSKEKITRMGEFNQIFYKLSSLEVIGQG